MARTVTQSIIVIIITAANDRWRRLCLFVCPLTSVSRATTKVISQFHLNLVL